MATNPDELTPEPGQGEDDAEDPHAHELTTDPKDEGGEGEGEGGDPPPAPTVEELAASMGWKPQDQYDNPDKPWKPAHEFILFTRDLERGYARELKGLRSQMDVMARTTADIVQDRLAAQREELASKYNELVEEGDAAGAYKVAERIAALTNRATQPPPVAPTPEGQEFAERHSHWLGKDQAATARAVEITNSLAAKGVPAADQLRAAERILKLEYPEYFTNTRNGVKPAPNVNRPGQRSPGNSNKQIGFSDMPADFQKVALDMVERGQIPNKEAYVKYYVQNLKGTR